MKSRFLSNLYVELLDEFGGLWQLDEALIYYSDVLGKLIVAPKGFVTDFASGPSLFWISLARDQGQRAAVIHDWLYSAQFCSREEADQVLREAMLASGYSKFTAGAFYAAVRAFGGSHWDQENLPQPKVVQDRIDMAG